MIAKSRVAAKNPKFDELAFDDVGWCLLECWFDDVGWCCLECWFDDVWWCCLECCSNDVCYWSQFLISFVFLTLSPLNVCLLGLTTMIYRKELPLICVAYGRRATSQTRLPLRHICLAQSLNNTKNVKRFAGLAQHQLLLLKWPCRRLLGNLSLWAGYMGNVLGGLRIIQGKRTARAALIDQFVEWLVVITGSWQLDKNIIGTCTLRKNGSTTLLNEGLGPNKWWSRQMHQPEAYTFTANYQSSKPRICNIVGNNSKLNRK